MNSSTTHLRRTAAAGAFLVAVALTGCASAAGQQPSPPAGTPTSVPVSPPPGFVDERQRGLDALEERGRKLAEHLEGRLDASARSSVVAGTPTGDPPAAVGPSRSPAVSLRQLMESDRRPNDVQTPARSGPGAVSLRQLMESDR